MNAPAEESTVSGATRWMQRPEVLRRPDPPSGLFEFALSLGGTVSAGAYTAGVLDFLVEALDEWDRARGADGVPGHRVRLQALSGTSGGGACAAAFAKSLAHPFAPERITAPGDPPNADSVNPLYRAWVLGFDFEQMCRVPRPAGRTLDALLHPGPLTNPVELPAGPPRAWSADPLTVMVTLTNLSGVPYKAEYGGDPAFGQAYARHVDYARIEFYYAGHDGATTRWPDALRVKAHPDADADGHPAAVELSWDRAWQFVRATSAFPVAFPTVALERPAWHYLYQPVLTPHPASGGATAVAAAVVEPAWVHRGQDPAGTYRFVAADGALLNNGPIELARHALTGLLGSLSGTRDAARRAIVHVDPLASSARGGARVTASLASSTLGTLAALLGHARYSTRDIALEAEPAGRSRFLVSAVRKVGGRRREGAAAIAGGALGGFSGFFDTAYRHHDFMLGRRNCQQFLHRHFTLSAKNPSLAAPPGEELVPIIPLVGSAQTPQPEPEWPGGRFSEGAIEGLLAARLEYVVGLGLQSLPNRRGLGLALLLPRRLAARLIARALARKTADGVKDALGKHRLGTRR